VERPEVHVHRRPLGNRQGIAEIEAAADAVGTGKRDLVALGGQLPTQELQHRRWRADVSGDAPDLLRQRTLHLARRHAGSVIGAGGDAIAGRRTILAGHLLGLRRPGKVQSHRRHRRADRQKQQG
jgi:hypothetical protein